MKCYTVQSNLDIIPRIEVVEEDFVGFLATEGDGLGSHVVSAPDDTEGVL